MVAGRSAHHRHARGPVQWRRAAAAAGLLAVALTLGIGVFSLVGGGGADSRSTADPGPSARHITARPTLPLNDTQIRQLLAQPADLGPLGEPERCLEALGHPAGTPVLGARPVLLGGRSAILLVLPAAEPSSVIAVAVGTDCPDGGAGVLARTELARP